MDRLNSLDLDIHLTIELRECMIGEYFNPSGKCIVCGPGTFSLTKMSSPGSCQQCPIGAVCSGGSSIGPKPGYWRPDNSSLYFKKCLNPSACLGMISPNNNPEGQC